MALIRSLLIYTTVIIIIAIKAIIDVIAYAIGHRLILLLAIMLITLTLDYGIAIFIDYHWQYFHITPLIFHCFAITLRHTLSQVSCHTYTLPYY